MRTHLRQIPQIAHFVTLGVFVTISLIGYLYAQNVTPPGCATQNITIQRLPPVAPLPGEVAVHPPYGNPGYNASDYAAPYAAPPQMGAPYSPPPLSAPRVATLPPVPKVPETIPAPKADEPAAPASPAEDKAGEKSILMEGNENTNLLDMYTSGPLGRITLDDAYTLVNEVRPDSMLVKTTRYLEQYVDPWDGSVQLGVDGTSGSSETFNIAFGIDAKRKLDRATFLFDIDYKCNTSEGVVVANRLFFNCRYEHPYGKGRWSFFVEDQVTYDEFQPWNAQVSLSSGVAHYLWKTDIYHIQGVCGGGFSQDIGGPDDECVPEVHFGFKGKHQITERQKLIASSDYYPDASNFNNSRIINKLSWEVLLDDQVDLSLKLNITDRLYCPNPGGKENDLDYAVLLMWQF